MQILFNQTLTDIKADMLKRCYGKKATENNQIKKVRFSCQNQTQTFNDDAISVKSEKPKPTNFQKFEPLL